MRRIYLAAVALCVLAAQPATAQSSICAPTGEIVAAAVEARNAGQGATEAKAAITDNLAGQAQAYAPAVQPLVDWVYELSEDDLQKDVAGSWVAQCEAQ